MVEQTKDVFYFGEDVDNYKDGKVANHAGSWLAGVRGAKPGLMMPGQPQVGSKYFQEVSPGVAMDYATIVNLDVTVQTPAGTFVKCVKTDERNALDPKEKEFKIFAPGIGLVQSGDLVATKYGTVR